MQLCKLLHRPGEGFPNIFHLFSVVSARQAKQAASGINGFLSGELHLILSRRNL